ncbi:MAG: hypothetical protein V3W18_00470 [candidate division Zixibacteria bacterium]
MRKTVLTFLALSLCLTLMPATVLADPADDCPRVGAYIDRVGAMIERASPIIMRSGNERAIRVLHSAIGEIRAANRAYEGNMCRVAHNHALQAEQYVTRALRMINRRRAN